MDQQPIFLSAQPDEFFFSWQLELQLFNFSTLGIQPDNIHVLVGFDPRRGPRPYFKELAQTNGHLARFYFYPDLRENQKYPASIKPHLIYQHLVRHPQLCQKALFLHDSDVVLKELPDLSKLMAGDTWYVSDTRSYLDSHYIKRTTSPGIFEKMCEIAGVSPGAVLENDQHAGGAQYLLKTVPASYWKKVEEDSVRIFDLLIEDNLVQSNRVWKEKKEFRSFNGIQAWCAEMWAMLYGAIARNRPVEISPELDFCWAADPVQRWEATKVLHYTGVSANDNPKMFQKNKYLHYSPFFDRSINELDRSLAGGKMAELIAAYNENRKPTRYDLTDCTFLIPFHGRSAIHVKNLLAIVWWLAKTFQTEIHVAELGCQPLLNPVELPNGCNYWFLSEMQTKDTPVEAGDFLFQKATSPIVVLLESSAILPPEQILSAINMLRNDEADMVGPHEGIVADVDLIFSELFFRILDADLLQRNIGKLSTHPDNKFQGCVCMLRRAVGHLDGMTAKGPITKRTDGVIYRLYGNSK